MTITWIIQDNDVSRLRDFISQHNNPFVAYRISRNVNRVNLQLNRNAILKALIMCLLTTQQRSGPNSAIGNFLRQDPFPLTIESIESTDDIEAFTRNILQQHRLNRYINRIPQFFTSNCFQLQKTNWLLSESLLTLDGRASKKQEREIADSIDDNFSGFGPKQSRNFLQALGLIKYEIPIDSRITSWLNTFGFPLTLSSNALQDKGYYHFVLDGIQELCERVGIYPCVLDAAIFSSFDNGQWTEENTIY
jgi:thermostable 8-oxoguanine DNA glycosylase